MEDKDEAVIELGSPALQANSSASKCHMFLLILITVTAF